MTLVHIQVLEVIVRCKYCSTLKTCFWIEVPANNVDCNCYTESPADKPGTILHAIMSCMMLILSYINPMLKVLCTEGPQNIKPDYANTNFDSLQEALGFRFMEPLGSLNVSA